MIRFGFETAGRLENLIDRRGFQAIGLCGVSLVVMYALFILEAVFAYQSYSVFSVFGWTAASVGSISAYIGFCMPRWFRRRYGSEQDP
ncbi:MAG: hypothetical protein ACTSU5_18230 [Promethearchaeota archaeon]